MRIPALLLAASLATAAHADLYMWTDASGRTQVSDRPPTDPSLAVKRIPVDESPPVVPVPARPKEEARKPFSDIAAKRRAERERLQGALDAARDKLAAARSALAQGNELREGDMQMMQRTAADPKSAPVPGAITAASRSNCRQTERDGKKSTSCAVAMPSESYLDRVAKLEQAVKDAEEEVADAERAYRRGVD